MSHSVKSIRKQFAEQGVFYTDARLAEMLREIVSGYGEVSEVYDPTCGNGNLLAAFPDNVRKFGQEIEPGQAEEARTRLTNCEIAIGDTLKEPAFVGRKFRHIVANYPFSIKWEPAPDPRWDAAPVLPPPSKANYAFILHILSMLADDGVAAVLGFPGILYRGAREGKIRQWIVEQNWVESVTLIEGGYFEDTNIATALIVFRKCKEGTDIRFVDHEKGTEYTASFEEVREQDFNLSPSSYIQVEIEKEEVDPVALEIQARDSVLKRLRGQLEFSSQAIALHEMLGMPALPPLSEFLNDIDQITEQYR